MGKNRYALFNCASVMDDRNIALNPRYYTLDNKTQNIHNEYSLLTQGLGSSKPTRDIERKWFDSLIGYDTKRRTVLIRSSAKAKYGIQNSPRQSMFINRTEAPKQAIERVNTVVKDNIIVDEFDILNYLNDSKPLITGREYDVYY